MAKRPRRPRVPPAAADARISLSQTVGVKRAVSRSISMSSPQIGNPESGTSAVVPPEAPPPNPTPSTHSAVGARSSGMSTGRATLTLTPHQAEITGTAADTASATSAASGNVDVTGTAAGTASASAVQAGLRRIPRTAAPKRPTRRRVPTRATVRRQVDATEEALKRLEPPALEWGTTVAKARSNGMHR